MNALAPYEHAGIPVDVDEPLDPDERAALEADEAYDDWRDSRIEKGE